MAIKGRLIPDKGKLKRGNNKKSKKAHLNEVFGFFKDKGAPRIIEELPKVELLPKLDEEDETSSASGGAVMFIAYSYGDCKSSFMLHATEEGVVLLINEEKHLINLDGLKKIEGSELEEILPEVLGKESD